MEWHSLADILQAICDPRSLDIFFSVAKESVKSDVLKLKSGITNKQFYASTRRLLKTGLIERSKGNFSLTSLGAVVYHAQLITQAGVNSYWKLKAIDSIGSSGQISENERIKLVKTILNDETMERILIRK